MITYVDYVSFILEDCPQCVKRMMDCKLRGPSFDIIKERNTVIQKCYCWDCGYVWEHTFTFIERK